MERMTCSGAQRHIEAHTRPGEQVLRTTPDHPVADRAGVVNFSPINGLTALITRAEAERALDQLEDEGGDLAFESLSGAGETGRLFPVPELAGILRERGYRLVRVDPVSRLRLRRRAG